MKWKNLSVLAFTTFPFRRTLLMVTLLKGEPELAVEILDCASTSLFRKQPVQARTHILFVKQETKISSAFGLNWLIG